MPNSRPAAPKRKEGTTMGLSATFAALAAGIVVAYVEKLNIAGMQSALLDAVLVGAIVAGLAVAASALRDRGWPI